MCLTNTLITTVDHASMSRLITLIKCKISLKDISDISIIAIKKERIFSVSKGKWWILMVDTYRNVYFEKIRIVAEVEKCHGLAKLM